VGFSFELQKKTGTTVRPQMISKNPKSINQHEAAMKDNSLQGKPK
jgi:hypothetical protein